MSILSQIASSPTFAVGIFQGSLSTSNFPSIIQQIKVEFFNFRPRFVRKDFENVLLGLLYLTLGQTTDMLVLRKGLNDLEVVGCPTHLLDLVNIMPKDAFQLFTSDVKLEFSVINNPWIIRAETLIRSGKFRNSLENIFSYLQASKASPSYWTPKAVITDKRHSYECTNIFNSTYLSVNGIFTTITTFFLKKKDFTESYSNAFTFFFDFRIVPTTNRFSQILSFLEWNRFNQVNNEITPLSRAIIMAQTAELTRWYFAGNSKIPVQISRSQQSGNRPPSVTRPPAAPPAPQGRVPNPGPPRPNPPQPGTPPVPPVPGEYLTFSSLIESLNVFFTIDELRTVLEPLFDLISNNRLLNNRNLVLS